MTRRRTLIFAGAIVSALAASAAVAATIQTYSQKFTAKRPGAATGMTFKSSAHDPAAPGGVPSSPEKVTITMPSGTKLNTGLLAKCGSPPKCPAASRVGSGAATVSAFGTPLPALPLVVYNRSGGLTLVVNATPLPPLVLKPAIQGEKLILTVPQLKANGQPIILTDLSLRINQITRNGKPYAQTPATCPSSHAWTFKARFDFVDGTTKSVSSRSPCSS